MTLPGPEDGHLRMPNYLVERFMKLRLNATQWQIIWAVWRWTLCWQKPGHWGNQPTPISIGDISEATDIYRRQVAREMKALTDMNIILREPGTGKAITSFNLAPTSWVVSEKTLVPNQTLAETLPSVGKVTSDKLDTSVGSDTRSSDELDTSPVSEKSLPPDTNLSVGKKLIKKEKETSTTKVVDEGKPASLAAQTPASKYLFEQTSRKRWSNLVQKKEFEKAESEVGEARMKEAIDWALTSGISNIKSIITAGRREKGAEPRVESLGRQRPRQERARPIKYIRGSEELGAEDNENVL